MSKASMLLGGLASLFVADAAALSGGGFRDSTTTHALFCDLQRIDSRFGSGGEVSYTSGGLCKWMEGQKGNDVPSRNESSFDSYNNAKELYRFNWTARSLYNPTTKRTVETLEAPPPRIDEAAAGRPYGRFTLETICDKDPWLGDSSTRCAAPKITIAGNLPADVEAALKYAGRPFTTQMRFELRQALRTAQSRYDAGQLGIKNATGGTRSTAASVSLRSGAVAGNTGTGTVSAAQRLQQALEQQRLQQQAAAMPTGGAGGSAPPPTSVGGGVGKGGGGAGAGSVAAAPATPPLQSSSLPSQPPAPAPTATPQARPPHVTAPRPGQRVPFGQFTVQATPPAGPAVASAELEFSWLAPLAGAQPPREPPPPARATVPMVQLANGMPVPPGAGPSSAGRWRLRARAAGAATWSEPVTFDVVAPQAAFASTGQSKALDRQGLNPQPLPPKHAQAKGLDKTRAELDRRGLNPQPLPPKEAQAKTLSKARDELERRGLNPQPLPPKEGALPRSALERTQ